MTRRAIQSPCPACGEPAERPPFLDRNGKLREPEPDRPWACSPCRAEHAGAIQIAPRWPHHATEFFPQGPTVPANLREGLVTWAQSLAQTAAWALELSHFLEGDSDPEAVAHAVMGGAPPWRLTLPADTGGFVLTEVPPDIARRLATACDLVEGPTLSTPELVKLRDARLAELRAASPPRAESPGL